jgi:hypothetical protein
LTIDHDPGDDSFIRAAVDAANEAERLASLCPPGSKSATGLLAAASVFRRTVESFREFDTSESVRLAAGASRHAGEPLVFVADSGRLWIGTLVHTNESGQPVVLQHGEQELVERVVVHWGTLDQSVEPDGTPYIWGLICECCDGLVDAAQAIRTRGGLWLCGSCAAKLEDRTR